MAITEQELADVERALHDRPDGVSMSDLVGPGASEAKRRSMRLRLNKLIDAGRARSEGERRWTRYFAVPSAEAPPGIRQPPPTPRPLQQLDLLSPEDALATLAAIPLSPAGKEIQRLVSRPQTERTPVGYNRGFLSSYQPNVTAYLSDAERQHLASVGITGPDQPAGTYARQILSRLLIDLSWNSSRLEGNTYSLLDTLVLLERGRSAEGKTAKETQMILNHKEAIEYLVDDVSEAGFNRFTILNLHALLSNNLLPDPMMQGRLRQNIVGIGGSVYTPLSTPAVIEECFAELLAKADAIQNPFEQSFFVSVHLPYLQAFEDVNKRVSRLAANIPFFKRNLSPVSFIDVPEEAYVQGMLGVYELNRTELARDVFIWSYERSSRRYAAIQQSIGEPDQLRLRYREEMRDLVSGIIRDKMGKAAASRRVAAFARQSIPTEDRQRFVELTEIELVGLHEGNFARYRVRPSEFFAWKAAWEA